MGQIASRTQLRMSFLRWALVTVPLVLLLGIGSGRLSRSGYGNPWFDALIKPAAMPPGAAFGIIWAILYVLLGLALALVISARGARGRGLAIRLFIVQLALNLAWSPLFFGAHRVGSALVLILVLLIVAAITAWRFAGIRPLAGALMVPYLAWLLFASYLNYEIRRLNPGAEVLAPGTSRTQISL